MMTITITNELSDVYLRFYGSGSSRYVLGEAREPTIENLINKRGCCEK